MIILPTNTKENEEKQMDLVSIRRNPLKIASLWWAVLITISFIFIFPTIIPLFEDNEQVVDIQWNTEVSCATNLVHIVIPLHNTSAEFLEDACATLQVQNYRHFKLWLIKDDNTPSAVAQLASKVRYSLSPSVVQCLHISSTKSTGDTLYSAFTSIRTFGSPSDILLVWDPIFAFAHPRVLRMINYLYQDKACLSSLGPMTRAREIFPYPVELRDPRGPFGRRNVAAVLESSPISFRLALWDFMSASIQNFPLHKPTWSAEEFYQLVAFGVLELSGRGRACVLEDRIFRYQPKGVPHVVNPIQGNKGSGDTFSQPELSRLPEGSLHAYSNLCYAPGKESIAVASITSSALESEDDTSKSATRSKSSSAPYNTWPPSWISIQRAGLLARKNDIDKRLQLERKKPNCTHVFFHVLVPLFEMPRMTLLQTVSSIVAQNYSRFQVHIFDDGSTNRKTRNALDASCSGARSRVNCTRSVLRKGQGFSVFETMKRAYSIALPQDVLIIVEADAFLSGPNALNRINEAYQRVECWNSWGSVKRKYAEQQGSLPAEISSGSKLLTRTSIATWTFSHPHTFKAFLFPYFKESDFKDQNGSWLAKVADRALVFNLLELSGPTRSCFVADIVYDYRHTPSLPTGFALKEQQKLVEYIQRIPSHSRLGAAPRSVPTCQTLKGNADRSDAKTKNQKTKSR